MQLKNFKIESLLSARLFLSPQLVGDRIFFLSDLSGRISLYAMNRDGSVPEPLLPPDIALQNPILLHDTLPFFVFPNLQKILVMLDNNGDENYQPTFIPLDGGIPEPTFGDRFKGQQVICSHADIEKNLVAFQVDTRASPVKETYLVDLETLVETDLGKSIHGNAFIGHNADYSKIILSDEYTFSDAVIYLWERERGERQLLYGVPLEQRREGEAIPLNSIHDAHVTPDDKGMLFVTSLFDDQYGLGYLTFDTPQNARAVETVGAMHRGIGELEHLKYLRDNLYLIKYNIDGVSYAYEGAFDESALRFEIEKARVGQGELSNGVTERVFHEKGRDYYALSFATATSPIQLYTILDEKIAQVTRERVLGIPQHLLAPGEDASFNSHDGLRISARLYLPAPELGFTGKRPVIYYVHGGPQSQERPDFSWFSMPLIQFFTLNGFAVFVPNARGSRGYGLEYMKRVDHDWGGQDRLDHVTAVELLKKDARLDGSRIGVTGRSYGGYMTLILAGCHPRLWKAACDMFGPYSLFTFLERLPETWQTYFHLALGHPERDREFLTERSPNTHLHQLACPLLVIQGRNDPRVNAAESRDLVEQLRVQGKQVEYLEFENEGHDVLKYENKVRCYKEIVRFFSEHLNAPQSGS